MRKDAAACDGCERSRSSMLLAAAVIYVATLDRDDPWTYVHAASEAAMVGAIADWFAVTALFRHPLGMPIPHTAIIPTRKNALAKSLQEFVTANFLSEDVIRTRVADAQVGRRLATWLADEKHSAWVIDEAAALGRDCAAADPRRRRRRFWSSRRCCRDSGRAAQRDRRPAVERRTRRAGPPRPRRHRDRRAAQVADRKRGSGQRALATGRLGGHRNGSTSGSPGAFTPRRSRGSATSRTTRIIKRVRRSTIC